MIRFAIGAAIIVFTLIMGVYRYSDLSSRQQDLESAMIEAQDKRDQGRNLTTRIQDVRKTTFTTADAQKLTIEKMLDIGAPGMEWRFLGQALVRGDNKSLYRYTFRISGPSTYAVSQKLLERMNELPGFVPYRYCFACTQPPRGTPENLSMVQIEGYLYAHDKNTLY